MRFAVISAAAALSGLLGSASDANFFTYANAAMPDKYVRSISEQDKNSHKLYCENAAAGIANRFRLYWVQRCLKEKLGESKKEPCGLKASRLPLEKRSREFDTCSKSVQSKCNKDAADLHLRDQDKLDYISYCAEDLIGMAPDCYTRGVFCLPN